LIFNYSGAEKIEDENLQLFVGRWKLPITYELASSVGSSSLEDHYWCSGWQTANVQLLVDLQPDDTILDVGCGVGRLAYGFHGWYGSRYIGVDIMPKAIEYCKTTFPRFEFYHLDVKSPYYNPNGALEPAKMLLPVEDQSIDVVILYSVYTHLLPETFHRMTSEIGRVLKSGGRCLASFLILDGQTDKAIFSFNNKWSDECRVENKDNPEGAVGYTKDFIERLFSQNGLHMKTSHQGTWTGKPGLTVQDQIVFVKD
jgi:SAM-dependent methyltransferase